MEKRPKLELVHSNNNEAQNDTPEVDIYEIELDELMDEKISEHEDLLRKAEAEGLTTELHLTLKTFDFIGEKVKEYEENPDDEDVRSMTRESALNMVDQAAERLRKNVYGEPEPVLSDYESSMRRHPAYSALGKIANKNVIIADFKRGEKTYSPTQHPESDD